MALPNTDTLDIASRALPAFYPVNLATGPNLNTETLDFVSRGLPAFYITKHTVTITGTNMKINIGDSWKDITAIKINIGDTWKNVTKIQINIGDVWKTIFP